MSDEVKKKWGSDELETIYDSPFNDLIWNSHNIHRKYHDPNAVQILSLIHISEPTRPY